MFKYTWRDSQIRKEMNEDKSILSHKLYNFQNMLSFEPLQIVRVQFSRLLWKLTVQALDFWSCNFIKCGLA